MQKIRKIVRAVLEKNGNQPTNQQTLSLTGSTKVENKNNNKQSRSRTPKGKRKKNNKQENEFGDKNNLETGLK